jgi:hypothetical protein
MTLPVVFHDIAEEELNEAAAYYARARPGLGDAFLAEVHHAIDELVVIPLAGTLVDNDVRWWLVRRFPVQRLVPRTRRPRPHSRYCSSEATTVLLAWTWITQDAAQLSLATDGRARGARPPTAEANVQRAIGTAR